MLESLKIELNKAYRMCDDKFRPIEKLTEKLADISDAHFENRANDYKRLLIEMAADCLRIAYGEHTLESK